MTNPTDEIESYEPPPLKFDGPEGETRPMWDRVVTRGADGLFRDAEGTIYALAENGKPWSFDDQNRAGVGLVSLSKDNVLSKAAPAHDYLTRCPAYQMFHYRIEGDQLFLKHVDLLKGASEHDAFWRFVGDLVLQRHSDGFWEIDRTAWGSREGVGPAKNEELP